MSSASPRTAETPKTADPVILSIRLMSLKSFWKHSPARLALFAFALIASFGRAVQGAEVPVAVASNFKGALEKIGNQFEAATGNKLIISSGSSGQLYAQIRNGAPFQVLLSADAERPALLEKDGFAVKGSRFPYAFGRLALWSVKVEKDRDLKKELEEGKFNRIALAQP